MHNILFFQAGMNLALLHACKARQKSPFFADWGVAELKQSLGSKNNGENLIYNANVGNLT